MRSDQRMACRHQIARVGVGDAEPGQDAPLQTLHRLRLAVVLVVVAEQMQETVHRKMGEMVANGLAFGPDFARDRLVGDRDVAEHGRPAAASPSRRVRATAAGKDSTLVGLSLPRHCALSARIAESSVSTIASSRGRR